MFGSIVANGKLATYACCFLSKASFLWENYMGGSSFFSLVFGAEFAVQLVILMLLVASIWSWSIIIDKWFKFREIKHKSFYFQKLFSSEQVLSDLYIKLKDIAYMPLELIFVSAMSELHHTDLSKMRVSDQSITNLKDRINTAMLLVKNKEIDILLSTDVLSEGQNLQTAQILINYDLHWNPTRMIQRAGRIDRIGSLYDKIYIYKNQ